MVSNKNKKAKRFILIVALYAKKTENNIRNRLADRYMAARTRYIAARKEVHYVTKFRVL